MSLESDQIVQFLLRERLRVTAAAAAIVRDVHSSDDVFQQVVIQALEKKREFTNRDHLLSWAIRAARHRAIDLARRKRLQSLPDTVLDLLEANWVDPNGVGEPERIRALHECIEKLSAPIQRILQLRYTEGLSAVAIADRLKRTSDAVYQTLSRTHRLLRGCIEQKLNGEMGEMA